jgi:hypothetical protein
MNDDVKNKLTELLGANDEKLAEAARVDAALCAAAAAFPERYATLRSGTIRPTIQEFADVLNGRGHEVTVRELEESTSSEAGVSSATIALRIVPKAFVDNPASAKKSFLELSFSANRIERKITVSSTNTIINSAGRVGKRAEYEIDAVTPAVVEAHVFHALGEALAGA